MKMKKQGFTLAEVIITLGIVGVVAAITLPALMADTTTAQIGPKLAKAIATFEQANAIMLDKRGTDALTDAELLSEDYSEELSKYLKGAGTNDQFITKDGVLYKFTITNSTPDSSKPPHQQRIDANGSEVMIDINGNTKPNISGADQFYFSWWNDGSLRPKGATNWNGEDSSADGGSEHWKTKCAVDSIPSDDKYCAGHVFENNLKALYK